MSDRPPIKPLPRPAPCPRCGREAEIVGAEMPEIGPFVRLWECPGCGQFGTGLDNKPLPDRA